MLTPKISGIFDCRKYDQSGKKAHDQREMLADTDNVTFSALLPLNGGIPEVFMQGGKLDEFCKAKASKRERAAAAEEQRDPVEDVVSVKFKIGANCKWFDKFAHPMQRPTNAELEENRYVVQIDFTRKDKNPAMPLRPSGYWVNAIMVSPIEQNPFAGQAFESDDDADEEQDNAPASAPAPTPAPAPVQDMSRAEEFDDGLPFA